MFRSVQRSPTLLPVRIIPTTLHTTRFITINIYIPCVKAWLEEHLVSAYLSLWRDEVDKGMKADAAFSSVNSRAKDEGDE